MGAGEGGGSERSRRVTCLPFRPARQTSPPSRHWQHDHPEPVRGLSVRTLSFYRSLASGGSGPLQRRVFLSRSSPISRSAFFPDTRAGPRADVLAYEQVARAGSGPACFIAGVGQLAGLERQTTAADASCELVPELLEFIDPAVEDRPPSPRESSPICLGRGSSVRQLVQGGPDCLQAESDPLRRTDESYPPQCAALEASLSAAGTLG